MQNRDSYCLGLHGDHRILKTKANVFDFLGPEVTSGLYGFRLTT